MEDRAMLIKEVMDLTIDELKTKAINSAETDGATTVRQMLQKLCKELDNMV